MISYHTDVPLYGVWYTVLYIYDTFRLVLPHASSTMRSSCMILQACVQRVIKSVLPDNVQIGKDAKAAFSRSAGIFIMYVALLWMGGSLQFRSSLPLGPVALSYCCAAVVSEPLAAKKLAAARTKKGLRLLSYYAALLCLQPLSLK